MSQRTSSLRSALRRALLVGVPFAALDCNLSSSSCPDDGVEPPLVIAASVPAGLAQGGPLSAEECESACSEIGSSLITCVRETADAVVCVMTPMPCEGRRPAGLAPETVPAKGDFERHLAEAARLEAASIEAFRVLRWELAFHGAPRGLLRAASRAARDERRHARSAAALARRFGVSPSSARVEPRPLRRLEEIAIENAVEGCVRETWGALVALRQAERAAEPAIRSAMKRIARDEIRHAELAWRVDAWLWRRMNGAARQRVTAARSRAVAQLSYELGLPTTGSARHRLGLPSPTEACVLVGELERTLWQLPGKRVSRV